MDVKMERVMWLMIAVYVYVSAVQFSRGHKLTMPRVDDGFRWVR